MTVVVREEILSSLQVVCDALQREVESFDRYRALKAIERTIADFSDLDDIAGPLSDIGRRVQRQLDETREFRALRAMERIVPELSETFALLAEPTTDRDARADVATEAVAFGSEDDGAPEAAAVSASDAEPLTSPDDDAADPAETIEDRPWNPGARGNDEAADVVSADSNATQAPKAIADGVVASASPAIEVTDTRAMTNAGALEPVATDLDRPDAAATSFDAEAKSAVAGIAVPVENAASASAAPTAVVPGQDMQAVPSLADSVAQLMAQPLPSQLEPHRPSPGPVRDRHEPERPERGEGASQHAERAA